MKYTALYLKYTVIVVLLLTAVIGLVLGGLCVAMGLLGTAAEYNLSYLVFIPAGLLFGFVGFVAFDCFKYLINKWELDKV